jgi:signal transduction histidine kinase
LRDGDTLLDLARSRRSVNISRRTLNESEPKVLNLQIRSAQEGLISLVVCLRDISHESHIERLKSEFMATAAHELRTPMTSIRGFIELLLLREESIRSDERKNLLNVIHKQSLLINSIIDDLLDLNKLESRSTSDLRVELLDMAALVRETVAAWPVEPGRRPPCFVTGDKPLCTNGDATYLRRAVMNLISNAFKYSEGQSNITIAVEADLDDMKKLRLSVTDEGRGMTAEQLARYGERFYRADESGTVPGTGLGVSIVKQIVELHGGLFSVKSTPNKGTCVTIQLPLALPA